MTLDLTPHGLNTKDVVRNATPAKLYEIAIAGKNAVIASSGALVAHSGKKTGRSPKDKRIVQSPESSDNIWWGNVNIPLSERTFMITRQRAKDFLNSKERLFVTDGFAGWDSRYRLKIRVICCSPYHALFMWNMLIRPTDEELETFGQPDYVIYNAGEFPANAFTPEMTSSTSVALSFEHREFVIMGTEYAGEMKKGVFTIMNYLMPRQDVLSMHCSANQSETGDVTLFFGLSGTGKTTLSTDPQRWLIGDDEHCWTDEGVFNIEGGCYAKAIGLSAQSEPEIYNAIRFGSVLENVVYDPETRRVDFNDQSITENTRVAYPIEFIPRAKVPCVGGHPTNIIFLTCDAFGVLPPVSRLSPEQAMYHFMSGYTAKVAGTEDGVTEPTATFSTCFGAAFMVWHPSKYAELLSEKIQQHQVSVWLVNTGWSGGGYGVGNRLKLSATRAIIDAIHNGSLAKTQFTADPIFGVAIPKECSGVDSSILQPKSTWRDKNQYDATAHKLAKLFEANFKQFADRTRSEIASAGPAVLA